ncbi:MAG: hypothetical protein R3Y13_04320 [bacterium]
MKKNRPTYYFMVACFAIFSILSIYGHFAIKGEKDSLINHNNEFYYLGELYFYDGSNNLLGTYTCKTENCGYAPSTKETNISNYYEKGEVYNLGMLEGYTFIEDGDTVYLYNYLNSTEMIDYDAIKFYNAYINEGYIFVKYQGKWGTFNIQNMSNVITAIYDDLSLAPNLNGLLLSGTHILASQSGVNFIIDQEGNTLTKKYYDSIIDYNSRYIFLESDVIYVNDYEGAELLSYLDITSMYRSANYYGFVSDGMLHMYNNLYNDEALEVIDIEGYSNISIVETGGGYEVHSNGEVIE